MSLVDETILDNNKQLRFINKNLEKLRFTSGIIAALLVWILAVLVTK
jgi:hypothetical protein